jgi:glycosyltransferase involved in cell wall biosynthesis
MNALAGAGVNGRGLVCMFAGQFERSYDLATVIRAAMILRDGGPTDVRFVLCGKGRDLEGLRRLGEGLDHVIFTGWVGKPTINAVMALSSVGLASYRAGATQSVPNKVAEYLAGGLAVASSLEGELATIVTGSGCGFNYAAGNAEELANRLRTLAGDPGLVRQLRASARALYEERFRVEAIYPDMVRHLERVGAP